MEWNAPYKKVLIKYRRNKFTSDWNTRINYLNTYIYFMYYPRYQMMILACQLYLSTSAQFLMDTKHIILVITVSALFSHSYASLRQMYMY